MGSVRCFTFCSWDVSQFHTHTANFKRHSPGKIEKKKKKNSFPLDSHFGTSKSLNLVSIKFLWCFWVCGWNFFLLFLHNIPKYTIVQVSIYENVQKVFSTVIFILVMRWRTENCLWREGTCRWIPFHSITGEFYKEGKFFFFASPFFIESRKAVLGKSFWGTLEWM